MKYQVPLGTDTNNTTVQYQQMDYAKVNGTSCLATTDVTRNNSKISNTENSMSDYVHGKIQQTLDRYLDESDDEFTFNEHDDDDDGVVLDGDDNDESLIVLDFPPPFLSAKRKHEKHLQNNDLRDVKVFYSHDDKMNSKNDFLTSSNQLNDSGLECNETNTEVSEQMKNFAMPPIGNQSDFHANNDALLSLLSNETKFKGI